MMYLIAAIIALLIAPAFGFGQAYQWTTFTSTSNVVDMMLVSDHVWTATNGGLSDYNPETGQFEIYANTRGLAMNQCVAIGKDVHGYIWAGLADGRITRINPLSGDVKQVVDLQDEVYEITDILEIGNEVFVSGNNGVYRFAYYPAVDNYRVLETIKVLGSFPGETAVSCLATAGGYLYAGTQFGIARAELNQAQLSPPGAWQTITSANSNLPENIIRTMQGNSASGDLNIATPSWIATRFTDGTWINQNLGGVRSFASQDFNLAATSRQIFLRNQSGQWNTIGSALNQVVRVDRNYNSAALQIVVGIADGDSSAGGLVFMNDLEPSQWVGPIQAPGIGSNVVTALAVGPDGRLWAGGEGSNRGVYVYDGHAWTNYTKSSGYTHRFFEGNPTSFAFDNQGDTWISTFGRGVAWFKGDSIQVFDSIDSTGFSSEGRRLSGIPGAADFVVTRLTRNAAGDIYITNRLTTAGLPLVRVSADWIARGNNPEPWDYFVSSASLPNSYKVEVEEVVVDPLNRVWSGPSRDGIYTFVFDPAVANPSSAWYHYRPRDRQDAVTCYENIGDQVLSWAVDSQGYLWIGTTNGAYYSQGGVPYDLSYLRFICVVDLPIGDRVNAVHVDAQDNKWFGTDQGAAVLDRNFSWVHVFRTASSVDNRSDLISNEITAITSNPRTGEVWIGTADGLSCYTSPYVSSDVDPEIWPYPNPFRADGTQRMCIDPQRFGGRFDDLRILTISGRLVRKLTWAEMLDCPARGGWDGRNDDGDLVAGGVYLLVATTNDGKSTTGKVAVLGR